MENVNVKIPGFNDTMERPFYKIKNGINPLAIDLGELGYGQEAVASYALFSRLQEEGEYLPTCASKHPSRRPWRSYAASSWQKTDCA